MDDPITNRDEPRLDLTRTSGARVVLAESDAPGSLHYLLEAEGFQVVGCASDEAELGRVLGQGIDPDVVVLDADIVATSILVARQLAPDAHVIAVWPDAVQPPPGGERIDPRMVYEELGPAIRRHMDRLVFPVPVIALPAEQPAMADVASVASGSMFTRMASRVSILSVTLITAILFTMGVSFALGGFRWSPAGGPPRVFVPRSTDAGGIDTSDPVTSRAPTLLTGDHPNKTPSDRHNGGNNHPSGNLGGVVGTTGDGDGNTGSTPPNQSGDTGQGGSGGGGQGDNGGGQGDNGGGQGDNGGGQGDNDQGDQGDNDQGGDQGGDDQGDQGGDDQGDQGGDGQGPHGENHGAHGDEQD
jgi:hypothetical protein